MPRHPRACAWAVRIVQSLISARPLCIPAVCAFSFCVCYVKTARLRTVHSGQGVGHNPMAA